MPIASSLSRPTSTAADTARTGPRVPVIPDETVVVRRAARAAEDDGDLLGARRLVELLPDDAEGWRWRRSLDEGLRLRADRPAAAADPGAAAAWWAAPAMRFGLESPRAAALLALASTVLHARGVPSPQRHRMAPGSLHEEPALLDAGLCDLGVLPLYLAQLAGPVRDQLVTLAEWSRQPATIWEVVDSEPGGLAVVDADGRRRVVTGASQHATGEIPAERALLYGRIVPRPPHGAERTNPVWGFAVPPLPVSRLSARRVLRAVARGAPVAERLRAATVAPERSGPRARPGVTP